MSLKVISPLLLILSMASSLGFASTDIRDSIDSIKLITSHSETLPVKETCSAINDLADKIQKILINNSCPSDSEVDYSSCQQSTFSLRAPESRDLQKILDGLVQINEPQCQKLQKSELHAKLSSLQAIH